MHIAYTGARPLLPTRPRRHEQQCHATKSQRHRWLPAKKTSHTVLKAYPYPAGILSNPDTDPHTPRMIAADGIKMHMFRPPCQRHNPLFLRSLGKVGVIEAASQLAYSNPALLSSPCKFASTPPEPVFLHHLYRSIRLEFENLA